MITPAPWTFETMTDRIADIEIFGGEGGCLVCTVNSENVDEQEHVMDDARLIAHAPELLEMLRVCMQAEEESGKNPEFAAQLRKVVEKAGGE